MSNLNGLLLDNTYKFKPEILNTCVHVFTNFNNCKVIGKIIEVSDTNIRIIIDGIQESNFTISINDVVKGDVIIEFIYMRTERHGPDNIFCFDTGKKLSQYITNKILTFIHDGSYFTVVCTNFSIDRAKFVSHEGYAICNNKSATIEITPEELTSVSFRCVEIQDILTGAINKVEDN